MIRKPSDIFDIFCMQHLCIAINHHGRHLSAYVYGDFMIARSGHLWRTLKLDGVLQAYTNPQGPGNAVEGAAAVYAHESHERQANAGIGRLAPGQALGTSQASTDQSNQAGISAVRA